MLAYWLSDLNRFNKYVIFCYVQDAVLSSVTDGTQNI